jgi:hypothetical protein
MALERLLELARDVIDDCMIPVLSRPLIRLTEEASGFINEPHERDELIELAEALDDVIEEWSFWPPETLGSATAEGPSLAALARLNEAIDAVERAGLDDESSPALHDDDDDDE